MKRGIDLVDDICAEMRPTKRLSMLHNTPKQWKEQRKSILKLSKSKLKELGDIESNLRKSVLINNTYRKMRRELREQCPYSTSVSFAAYPSAEAPSRVPAPKSHSGYTSMARESYSGSCSSYDVPAPLEREEQAPNSLCQYAAGEDESQLPAAVSDEEVRTMDIDRQLACTRDGEVSVQSYESSTATDGQPSLDLCEDTKENRMETELVQDGQGCADICANDEPIDYTVKAKDLAVSSQCYREQSPLTGSEIVDHSHTRPRSCEGTEMDLQMTASPSQQGPGHNDTKLDQLEKVGPEINSNDQALVHSSDAAQDQSANDSQDFSLCKYASRPYGYLPNILGPDVIPFSTSSLVSIIASREYQSTAAPCLSQSQATSAHGSQPKDSSAQSASLEGTNSTHCVTSGSSASQLFCEGDLQATDKTSRLDTSVSETIPSEGFYSAMNCDSDVNQNIWACFQHFNMAVACS